MNYAVGVECLGFAYVPYRVTMGEQVGFRVCKVAQ